MRWFPSFFPSFLPLALFCASQRKRPQGHLRKYRSRKCTRLAFDSLERRDLLASVVGFALDNDTGISSTDEITSDPTVGATVSWTDQNTAEVRVEFDHNGDGVKEGSINQSQSGGGILYNPLGVDPTLNTYSGSWTLRYRAVELDG